MKWRYATKAFDPQKKVSSTDLNILKEAIQLAPTSYGLQPYEVLIIENESIKNALVEHSYNQKQVADCSHLFVFCHYIETGDDKIDDYMRNTASIRDIEIEKLTGFRNAIKGTIDGRTKSENQIWAAKQCYLAMANLLNACAHLKIDSCPMEGFVPQAYSDVLDLEKENLFPCLATPVGYRAADDSNAQNKKVRKKSESLFRVL